MLFVNLQGFSSIEQYETHRFNESAPEILNLINTMIYLEILIIFFNNDKKLKLLFYKYFTPLIIKNKLVAEKFIKDYKKYQKVIGSFYT